MSKKVTIRLKPRRPSDAARYLEMIAAACPPDADLDLTIDCAPVEQRKPRTRRVDEQLETLVCARVSDQLDRREQLAKAVAEHRAARSLRAMQEQAEQYVENRRTIREWFADAAKAGWTAAVKVATEVLLKGSGS